MQNHVLDYLNKIVKEKPDKVAFADDSEALTFEQVYRQSRAVGSFLHGRGICGKPVVVFMNKQPREIAAFFGVITGGDFYVPIDEEMPRFRIELILENVQSPLLICDRQTEEMAREFDFGGEIVLYDDIAQTPVEDEALQEIYDRAIDTDPIYIEIGKASCRERVYVLV